MTFIEAFQHLIDGKDIKRESWTKSKRIVKMQDYGYGRIFPKATEINWESGYEWNPSKADWYATDWLVVEGVEE